VLLIGAASGTTVSGNVLTDNDAGVLDSDSDGSAITDNAISRNRYAGVYADTGQVAVTANRISDAPTALGVVDVAYQAPDGASSTVTATGNLIGGQAKGVQVIDTDTGDTSTPQVAAHFNRIAGNATGYETNSQVNQEAENNWWGCNAGPGQAGCDTVVGDALFSPWLILKLTSSRSRIQAGGHTATLTASLRQNVIGETFASPPFPASPVAFKTDRGTLDKARTTIDGAATSRLVSGPRAVVAHVRAILDNQTANTAMRFTPQPLAAWLAILTRSASVSRSGRLYLRVRCPQPSASCRGTLALTAVLGHRTETIAVRQLSVPARRTVTLRLTVGARARDAARSRRGLLARATAKGPDAHGGHRRVSELVSLRR
jgi:parallel beta-helix repeat protein